MLPLDDLRAQLEVNVIGQLAITQPLLGALRRGRGRVVFVGSVDGRLAFPYAGAYTASKHAIEALADAMRAELREDGVEVVLVEPAVTDTRIWRKAAERNRDLIGSLPAEQGERYRPELEKFEHQLEPAEENGADPAKVAEAIAAALDDANPSARYPVGLSGKAVFRLRPLLPDRLVDALTKRLM